MAKAKNSYTVWYRQPGQWFWRKVKNVTGDGIYPDIKVRFLTLEDDTLIHLSVHAEVKFHPYRMTVVQNQMNKEAGLQVQRR